MYHLFGFFVRSVDQHGQSMKIMEMSMWKKKFMGMPILIKMPILNLYGLVSGVSGSKRVFYEILMRIRHYSRTAFIYLLETPKLNYINSHQVYNKKLNSNWAVLELLNITQE